MPLTEAELIYQIESAFDDVTLGEGTSLNMAVFYDSYCSASEFEERAKKDERQNWKWIHDTTLERFKSTFCFTDLLGYRFYLPAYMRWTIKNHGKSDNIISDFTIYAIDPRNPQFKETQFIDWFTRSQLEVILAFLDFCADDADSFDAKTAIRNAGAIRKLLADRSD